MKTIRTLMLSVAVFVTAPGCGGRTLGLITDGGTTGPDGWTIGDGATIPDAYLVDGRVIDPDDLHGRILLYHHRDISYTNDWLVLTAAFYTQPYEEPIAPDYEFQETRTTPNGVPCDIYFRGGMMGPEPPPPPPPPQANGGTIVAGTGTNNNEYLIVRFEGAQYSVDTRSSHSQDNPLPFWLRPETQELWIESEGSPRVEIFSTPVDLPGPPVITAPDMTNDPIQVDMEGNYTIRWSPSDADDTKVFMGFNMDWDDSLFACRPAPGTNELKLPMMWVMDWTWGSGEVNVVFENREEIYVPQALVRLTTRGSSQFYANFELIYP